MDTILQSGNTLTNIVKDFGLEDVSEDVRKDILLKMTEALLKRIILVVWEKLSDGDQDEFDKVLMEKPNDEKAIMSFLRSKIPNLDEMVNQEVVQFKQESIELMAKLREDL